MKILNFISQMFAKRKIRFLRRRGVKIGCNTIILSGKNNFSSEPYLVSIGNNCLISAFCYFVPHDGGTWVLNNLNQTKLDKIAPIVIGDNTYIGMSTIVIGGVTIGDNCIIGAGSIVTKDIPNNMVAAGVPAKIICTLKEYIVKNEQRFDQTFGMKSKAKKKYYLSKYQMDNFVEKNIKN